MANINSVLVRVKNIVGEHIVQNAVMEVEIEELKLRIEQLEALIPKDVEVTEEGE